MDALLATYKDEEEDDQLFDAPPPTTTAPDAATVTVTGSMDVHPQPQIDVKLEPDPSDDPSDDASECSDQPNKSPKLSPGNEDEEPLTKKQKNLSSLTAKDESPSTPTLLPDAVNNNIGSVIASATTPLIVTNLKKSKKKNNNVWATKSKKGKKKSKIINNNKNNNNHANGEDKVLITPVPRFPDKNDDTAEMNVCLSKVYKAEKVELSDDRMGAGSTKGYRMVRATRGVVEGAWYFEIKIVKLGQTGHTRLGWSTERGDLQAPVGFDGNSFGYRDIDGSKIHKALREKYGEEGYKEDDVIGFYINLPDGEKYAPKAPHLVWYKGQRYVCGQDSKEDPATVVPGSEISFFKNGVCQGVAFKDLYGGCYYPAASMYTLPNEPNCTVKFNFGPDFEFFPEDFNERPIPKPMIEVPYHGFDNQVENGESTDKKSSKE
ncbi:hypothetical protein Lal_00019064 [Lupinus albus]|uniref:Putative concanavalin A-like lectin/glucanase domain-containing protein n=1 Tax=Lupinus albus TaxID=3870 RepID=A0A6A4R2N1_LUPAL|nr:putative concanavalin A-like lectin/glucanase domain-containing protein [Lupinus albus]KAF1898943.1 hypothetical protein Lal_00019064 [Lupinus albus]